MVHKIRVSPSITEIYIAPCSIHDGGELWKLLSLNLS